MNCPACGASNETAGEHCFSCGKTLFALTEGTVVAGRYELRQMLGRGGMGIGYRAFDRALEEEVALKILHPDVASTADLERRFRSEIKLARRVRHRNVCGIHEYGQDGPIHYIAMELVAGEAEFPEACGSATTVPFTLTVSRGNSVLATQSGSFSVGTRSQRFNFVN